MLRWTLWLLAAPGALALGALLTQCADAPPPEDGPQVAFDQSEARDLLPGTWLREYTEQGVRVHRVLTLDADGNFREVSSLTEPGGRVTHYVHAGNWLFDGTNLKRRYTSINGDAPSRLAVPFATFAIVFDTRNEFTGVDHIHGRTIHYHRVDDGDAS